MHCELLIGLGSAQRQLGRAEFRDTLLEAAHEARRIGATDLLVRAAGENTRGFVSETGEVDGERVAMLRAALDALTDADGAERSRLLSTLAAELTFARDWPRPLELSNEALATARQLGDPKTLSDVLSVRFMATWTPRRFRSGTPTRRRSYSSWRLPAATAWRGSGRFTGAPPHA